MTLPDSLKLENLDPAFVDYIRSHTEPVTALEHERTFKHAEPYLRPGVMLDWGCFVGFDAWRLRQKFGDQIELHGCDVHPPVFAGFWNEIGMRYQTLPHPWKLPYHDDMFDTIIGAGTLEHVPDESASLRELWRVLKPYGILVLTHMPQRHSLIEAYLRWENSPHHKRRYTRRSAREKLINHGFIPKFIRRHHSTPMRGPQFLRNLWSASANLLECSPAAFLTQNLMTVSVKMHGIGGEFFTAQKWHLYGKDW